MIKSYRIFCLALIVLMMTVSSSWAGLTWINAGGASNNAANISLEALGTARNITLLGTGAPAGPAAVCTQTAVAYVIGQNLTSGNLVRITLQGAAFTGAIVRVAAFNQTPGSIVIAEAAPTPGSTTFNFQLAIPAGNNVTAGGNNAIWLTSASAANIGILAADADDLMLQFPATASAATATATIDIITSGGLAVDNASSGNLANLIREFVPVITTRLLTIDYLVTPFNGTLFTNASSGAPNNDIATNAATNFGFNITYAAAPGAMQYSIGGAGANAGLTTAAVVNFDSTNTWTGVNRVYLGGGSCALAANVSNVVNSPSGAIALNLATSAWNQTAAANYAPYLCIQVDRTTNLVSRNITGSVTINVAGAGANPQAATSGTFQSWTPNGYQAFMPHMRYGDTTKTFMRLVNTDTRSAGVLATIILPDGTTIRNANIGVTSIPAGQTVTLSAQKIATLNSLTVDNFSLQVAVLVSNNSIFANGYFNLNAGGVWTTRDATVYDSGKQAYGLK